jgi:hypothetical protein
MMVAVLVVLLVALALAAMRYGFDSRPAVTDLRRNWV